MCLDFGRRLDHLPALRDQPVLNPPAVHHGDLRSASRSRRRASPPSHADRQLSKRHSGRPGTFYCWYDEQAGQLRCSLTSKTVDELPFGGRYRPTPDVTDVLRLAASDAQPGIIPWDELTEVQDSAGSSQRTPDPFPVWAAALS